MGEEIEFVALVDFNDGWAGVTEGLAEYLAAGQARGGELADAVPEHGARPHAPFRPELSERVLDGELERVR